MTNPFAWIGILSFCGVSALIGGWMLSDRRNARLVQRSLLGARETGKEIRRKKRKKRSLPD
jgi:magnesium transporter